MEATEGQGQREERAMNKTSGPLSWARPATMLRAEGAVLLAGGAASYWLNGEPWWLFALLLLAPDVSMVGYLAGPRVGAALYNVFHSYPLPAALRIFGLLAGAPLAVGVASVWFAHIGMDRMVGYGLKYASGFKDAPWAGVGFAWRALGHGPNELLGTPSGRSCENRSSRRLLAYGLSFLGGI